MHQKSRTHLGESKIARSPAFAMRQGHPPHAWMRGPAMMVNPWDPETRPGDVCRKRFRNSEMPRMKSLHRPAKSSDFFCLDLCKQIPKPFQVSILFNGRLIFHHFPTLHRQQQLRSNFFLRAIGSIHAASLWCKSERMSAKIGRNLCSDLCGVCLHACIRMSQIYWSKKKSGNHRNMSKISSFVKGPSNVETHSSILLAFSKDDLRMPVSRTSGSVSASFRGSCWYVGTKMALQQSNVR